MITPGSRYAQIEVASLTTTRNHLAVEIRYLRRRFTPSQTGQVTIVQHTVRQGDRLDNITARYLGDPLQFWRICDVNNVFRPDDLTDTIGGTIRIALPMG